MNVPGEKSYGKGTESAGVLPARCQASVRKRVKYVTFRRNKNYKSLGIDYVFEMSQSDEGAHATPVPDFSPFSFQDYVAFPLSESIPEILPLLCLEQEN